MPSPPLPPAPSDQSTNGIAGGLIDGEARKITMLVATLVVTVVVSVVFRRRLSRAYRAELDAVPWPTATTGGHPVIPHSIGPDRGRRVTRLTTFPGVVVPQAIRGWRPGAT